LVICVKERITLKFLSLNFIRLYRMFLKELYNFESIYKFIHRTV
jgi:hypothetical protein